MQDDDIDIVLCLVKKSIRQWAVPFISRLAEDGPDPFKILVACILSLRTRDQTTAEASERLFTFAADPFSLANMNLKKLEKAIFPVGFYRTKAKQIRDLSKQICQKFQGKVPDTIEALVGLPGVGRKTANLVRTVGYKKPGICVDIHVHRICHRLGYVASKSPDETESILLFGKNFPKNIGSLSMVCWFHLGRINALPSLLGVVPARFADFVSE